HANEKIRGIGFFRTVYAMPLAISSAAAAVVWRLIFHPSQGILNTILGAIGLPTIGWLTDPRIALVSVAVTTILMHIGFSFIVLLGGLQALPTELYESAAIDGAGRRHQLRHVTLPLLSPLLFFVSVVLVINSLQSFGQVAFFTGGGPASAPKLIMVEIYQNAYVRNQVWYARAQTSVQFLFIMVITVVNN